MTTFDQWVQHGFERYRAGDHDGAVQALEAARAADPQSALVHVYLGIVARRAGDMAKSLAWIERAIHLDPQCAEAWSEHGETLERNAQWERALSSYDRALEVNPQHSSALSRKTSLVAKIQMKKQEGVRHAPGPAINWPSDGIHETVRRGDPARLSVLLRQKRSLSTERAPLGFSTIPEHARHDGGSGPMYEPIHSVTPLHCAAIWGVPEAVPLLLAAGASIHEPMIPKLRTALHLAAFFGQVEVAEVLIERGADRQARDEQDQTPLDAAMQAGRVSPEQYFDATSDLGFSETLTIPLPRIALDDRRKRALRSLLGAVEEERSQPEALGTAEDVFTWLAGAVPDNPHLYLTLLHLGWSKENARAEIEAYRRLALLLREEPETIRALIRDDNWRATLVGLVVVILLRDRSFLDDLVWRLTHGSWVAPQLAAAVAIVAGVGRSEPLEKVLATATPESEAKTVLSTYAALRMMRNAEAIAFEKTKTFALLSGSDGDGCLEIAKQHWRFWSEIASVESSSPPPGDDAAADDFERRFLAWIHRTLGIHATPHQGTNAGSWKFVYGGGEVELVVVGKLKNTAAPPGAGIDWLLRIEEHEPAPFIALVEKHFTPGSGLRRRMHDGSTRVQFKSSELRPGAFQ